MEGFSFLMWKFIKIYLWVLKISWENPWNAVIIGRLPIQQHFIYLSITFISSVTHKAFLHLNTITRGPKGNISCTWVHWATFLTDQPGWQFLLTHRPQKHKLGRRHWYLASIQVSLNSVQRFQRRSRKCLSQSEVAVVILFFRSAQKNTNLVEDVEILLLVKFCWILFSGFNMKRDFYLDVYTILNQI